MAIKICNILVFIPLHIFVVETIEYYFLYNIYFSMFVLFALNGCVQMAWNLYQTMAMKMHLKGHVPLICTKQCQTKNVHLMLMMNSLASFQGDM